MPARVVGGPGWSVKKVNLYSTHVAARKRKRGSFSKTIPGFMHSFSGPHPVYFTQIPLTDIHSFII